jgi:hypothetical protein
MAKPVPFEKSKRDVEPKGMREGSKREEALDRKQAKSKVPSFLKKAKCGK